MFQAFEQHVSLRHDVFLLRKETRGDQSRKSSATINTFGVLMTSLCHTYSSGVLGTHLFFLQDDFLLQHFDSVELVGGFELGEQDLHCKVCALIFFVLFV